MTIQMHTSWNFSSVLFLRREDIDMRDFPARLQSIKSRTRDQTPAVIVERRDEAVVLAIGILSRRLSLLIEQCGDRWSSTSPWLSARSLLCGKNAPIAAWQIVFAKFQARHGLPAFSPEQLRVQCLAAVSLNPGGLQSAMLLAGHSSQATTYRYVDKLLLQRYNAANSLEFERRLDATVRYMIDPKDEADAQPLIAYPIGDGTSCQDPFAPPSTDWLEGGICDATRCHLAQGCSNRRLIITRDRIEEVVRTKHYYESSWMRLIGENEVGFERVHLPSMLFNFALHGVLARGPYRHLVRCNESSQSS
jgi:hypothetical protein